MTTPILLDVDTGIDDALALLYAVASTEARLVGVSCAAGNVSLDEVTTNTAAVLDLAGHPEVEVAPGCAGPVQRPLMTTPETHGPTGTGYGTLEAAPDRISGRSGIDLIVDSARAEPGEITLVALGPLTNVAVALRREPRLLYLLKRLVIMGGCFTVAGNTAHRTEWNMHVDPEAAKEVFAAAGRGPRSLPLVMPLDVTEQARLLPHHVARIAEAAGASMESLRPLVSDAHPLLSFIADALRFYMEFHDRYDGFYGAFVHDPFAVAAALDPCLVSTADTTVDVETSGELTTGETVADFRRAWGREPNAAVALDGRADLFLERLVTRIAGLVSRHGGGS
ncbi:MAG: nucleoside hydrolase [Acidimicrobiia bacterium]|nr:nucleoside hydrolase [Acidimicrobiia bacterium]MYF82818.1 nucleoside hydrolase [Acidimicrobiia bacterium]